VSAALQLQIDVLADAYEANELTADLTRALSDAATDPGSYQRLPNETGSQDFGAAVLVFLGAWLPAALGSALGQWVAMRPHSKVKLTRRRAADGSSVVIYEGPARNVTEDVLKQAFED
jgi:hypothetical protein